MGAVFGENTRGVRLIGVPLGRRRPSSSERGGECLGVADVVVNRTGEHL
jgi:hypothetical protein